MAANRALKPYPEAQTGVDVSILIVNWNVRDLLERCLASLLASASPVSGEPFVWRVERAPKLARTFEVLVVDSASVDDSVSMVRERFPGVRLFASETNLGYTGGNNLGIQQSCGRYVLVLNPDTRVVDGAIWAMLELAEANPDVAVVGPQLLWPDGNVQSSRRRFPDLRTALVDSTFVEKWFPNHRRLRWYKLADEDDCGTSDVDWVVGACLLVRREAIEQVGLLDDEYFMYSEELDWQKRFRDAGWRVVYLGKAQVIHYHGKSSDQVGALTHIRYSRSKVRYFRKHHGVWTARLVRSWLLGSYVYEWAVEAVKWCLGHRRVLRRERMRTYAQVLRSGLRN